MNTSLDQKNTINLGKDIQVNEAYDNSVNKQDENQQPVCIHQHEVIHSSESIKIDNDNETNNDNKSPEIHKINENSLLPLQSYLKGVYYRKYSLPQIKKDLNEFEDRLCKIFIEKVAHITPSGDDTNGMNDEFKAKYYEINDKIDSLDIDKNKYNKLNTIRQFEYNTKTNLNENLSEDEIIEILSKNVSSLYIGDYNIKDNKKEGKGELYQKNGDSKKWVYYTGNFLNGNLDDYGKCIDDKGIIYMGKFQNGKLNGEGLKFNPESHNYYYGDFVDNKKHGKGILKTEVMRYNGSFEDDAQTGECEIEFESGDHYEGGIKNGKFEGKGKCTWKKKNHSYEGEYKDGKFDGKGIYRNDDKDDKWYYEGQYKNGKKMEKVKWYLKKDLVL